ncbi:hypothetical protein D3C80_1269300 [compost metagenome]
MIARQVGEHRHIERQRRHPALVQTVGGDFHGHRTGAGILQVGQGGLHADRIRRGMPTEGQGVVKTVAQGADDAAALAQQIQGLGQQLADAGLAVGAGDTDQMQAPARLAIEAPGDGRQLPGQALDRQQLGAAGRHRRRSLGLIGHCRGAAGNRIGNMHAAVLLATRHGKEQITGAHLATIQGQFTDQHRTGGFRQQLIQRHGHQMRPPLTAFSAVACDSTGGARLSGTTFIRRRAPAMTLPNTGAETKPP